MQYTTGGDTHGSTKHTTYSVSDQLIWILSCLTQPLSHPNQTAGQLLDLGLPVRHLVVHGERHILLEVLQALRDVLLDPERQAQLINLFLVAQLGQNCGAAPVLQVDKVPLQHAQRHLRLGCRAAHNGVERLADLGEAGEGHAEAHAVLEVGERARHAVKVEPDGGGDVLLEALDVLLVAAGVPEEALVAEAPAGLVLAQHVHEGVHVEAGLLGPDPEHHARPEDPGGGGGKKKSFLTVLAFSC